MVFCRFTSSLSTIPVALRGFNITLLTMLPTDCLVCCCCEHTELWWSWVGARNSEKPCLSAVWCSGVTWMLGSRITPDCFKTWKASSTGPCSSYYCLCCYFSLNAETGSRDIGSWLVPAVVCLEKIGLKVFVLSVRCTSASVTLVWSISGRLLRSPSCDKSKFRLVFLGEDRSENTFSRN